MSLNFDPSSCVRASSKFSQCTKCVDICPVSTIKIVDNIPAFTPSSCIECGGCVGSCPTESFSLSDFSAINFFFGALEKKEHKFACKTELPCLSVLSVEHLIALALGSDEPLILDAKACACGGDSGVLNNQIEANIEEANFVLSSFSSKQILVDSLTDITEQEHEESVRDRRSFLSLKGAMKSKQDFDKAVEADELKKFELDSEVIMGIKDKKIPDKRKLLFSLLKRQKRPEVYEVLATEDVGFTSQKFVDASCTNCQICYRICPTSALSSDMKFSVINFDAMMCVKCHLCHDVCEPNAIQLQPGFEIKEFFEPKQRTLAKFDIQRCNECGNYFTYTGGVKECFRCKIEEDEAMELHENAKKMDF
ncbi:ferredoxin [bacterium]|nr:ferredoxin [bacterium]MBU1957319.1 ferredoxin [bacterium]